jgi:hypothetical protein
MSGVSWFRGNLHAHSFWSDGHDFPEMIAEHYKSLGYQFLAFTEHDRLQEGIKWLRCQGNDEQTRSIVQGNLLKRYQERFGSSWVDVRKCDGGSQVRLKTGEEIRHLVEEGGRFLIISGEEVTARWGTGDIESTNWVNVLNLRQAVRPIMADQSVSAIRSVCNAVKHLSPQSAAPVICCLNHPNWKWNSTAEDITNVDELRFMEMHTALNTCANQGDALHPSVERMWDIALTSRLSEKTGAIIYGLASDDAHAYQPDHHLLGDWALPGRAWIMVRAKALEADVLMTSIQQGDYYCSTGVTLEELEVSRKHMRVVVDAVPGASYETQFIGTRDGYDRRSFEAFAEGLIASRVTRHYSDEVGEVLAEIHGECAEYQARGDELYVRARVTSSLPHPNPSWPRQRQQAWTQPSRCS